METGCDVVPLLLNYYLHSFDKQTFTKSIQQAQLFKSICFIIFLLLMADRLQLKAINQNYSKVFSCEWIGVSPTAGLSAFPLR